MIVSEQILCQKCLAVNSLRREHCSECGTRLMLIVPTRGGRFEDQLASETHREHLVERVSYLESNLLRTLDRVAQTIDLQMRQANATSALLNLLQAVISALDEAKLIDGVKVFSAWRERADDQLEKLEAGDEPLVENESIEIKFWRTRIIDACRGVQEEDAAEIVREAFAASSEGKLWRALNLFERAAASLPNNKPLNSLLGQHYFRQGKYIIAQSYLQRADQPEATTADEAIVSLLLGVLLAEAGNAGEAAEQFGKVIKSRNASFAVCYAVGRLCAFEGGWEQAATAWETALSVRSCPEGHYATAFAYKQMNRFDLMLSHLRQAVELDRDYLQAWVALADVANQIGNREEAARAQIEVHRLNRLNGRSAAAPRSKRARTSVKKESGAFNQLLGAQDEQLSSEPRKNLLTSGDERLARFFTEDLLAQLDPALTQIFGRL